MQTGSLHVFNQDLRLAAVRKKICRRVAYMPQGLGKNLYPTLSVMENIRFFARLFGERGPSCEQRIQFLLQATGLAPFIDRPAAKLSGGMKQKLGLCCALIHEPDLLILDEPTTGVDPLSRRQFWQLLADLRAQHPSMSILVATAYMEEASYFDWLAMMDAGQLLAQGSPQALLQKTGTTNLDATFIQLLPAHKKLNHVEPVLPPMAEGNHPIAISARNLSCQFGEFTAVDNVNFDIRQGEIFGFLGSNGCGKTTTMKMLTGLLPATEGEAFIFGKVVDAGDLNTRRNIGYMSQSFSLYEELTVQQNMDLHGRIYGLSPAAIRERCETLYQEMDLGAVATKQASALPLGVRQRLSLAVAVIHKPSMLILDEPTSGVDPVARDQFWTLLIHLCREDKVTIFITTHYMNEAERCDRLSLMHAGRVLASGTPQEIKQEFAVASLEEAFIHVLEQVQPAKNGVTLPVQYEQSNADDVQANSRHHKNISAIHNTKNVDHDGFSVRRLWAYAHRETLEFLREPIRWLFAAFVPVFLLIVLGLGINFDVDELNYAVLDHDHSPASREYLQQFSSSQYFIQKNALQDYSDLEYQLASGHVQFVLEMPPDFGKQLTLGQHPTVGVWIDGSYPFRAERARSYILGLHQRYMQLMALDHQGEIAAEPYRLETRFRYNQDMASVYAIVPSVIAVLMTLIPSMLMAVAVVREKELGSIINFYATPIQRFEFLWGKQFPYVVMAILNFLLLVLFTRFVFMIPIKGSVWALLAGGVCYSFVATSMGLFVSTFTRTQIAALFAAMISAMVPSVNFSGMLKPVASLDGGAYVIGQYFPTTYLLNITVGTFTKGLGFQDLWQDFAAIAAFFVVLTAVSALLLRKQDV